MNNKIFKKTFDQIATSYGLEKGDGGWYRENGETLITLNLQKSNYSNLYYLNVKTYIYGLLDLEYKPTKYWIVNHPGNVFIRQPNEYTQLFNLESDLSIQERESGLDSFFEDFLIPYIKTSSTIRGIKELSDKGKIYLFPEFESKLMEMKKL